MTAISEQQSHYRYEGEKIRRRSSIQKIKNSNSYGSLTFVVAITFFAAAIQMTTAFVMPSHSARPASTRLFLEDWVADMIDGELYRGEHREEYEAAWMEKNKGAVLSRLETTGSAYPSIMLGEEDREAMAEHRRDERMAFMRPEKYCADRCVATGNCDILEDFYELSPEDVLKFCEECVLNFDVPEDGDEGCVVPDAFYEKEPPLRP